MDPATNKVTATVILRKPLHYQSMMCQKSSSHLLPAFIMYESSRHILLKMSMWTSNFKGNPIIHINDLELFRVPAPNHSNALRYVSLLLLNDGGLQSPMVVLKMQISFSYRRIRLLLIYGWLIWMEYFTFMSEFTFIIKWNPIT